MAKKRNFNKQLGSFFGHQKELFLSLLLTAGLYFLLYFVANWTIPGPNNPVLKLYFAIKWLIFPLTTLWLGYLVVIYRSLRSGTFAPLVKGKNESTVHHKHTKSTLRAFVLLFFAVLMFSLYLPSVHMAIIPTICLIFALGRLVSWYGHMRDHFFLCYFGKVSVLLTTVVPLIYLTVRILILNFM